MSLIDHLAGDSDQPRENPFALTPEELESLEINDDGNARRLLAAHGARLLFVTGRGWGVWDGNRFSFRSGELKARELAASLPDLVQREIDHWRAKKFDDLTLRRAMEREHAKPRGRRFRTLEEVADHLRAGRIAALTAHKVKCGNVDKQLKALRACEWRVRAEVEDLDADPWKLVVPNGVIDLRAVAAAEPLVGAGATTAAALGEWRRGWLRPPDPSFRPTRCAGAPFVPAAECPEWERFVELIMPDPAVRQCLQRALGALLFGENAAQAAFMLRGAGGNGKSTLVETVARVLGTREGYAEAAKIEIVLHTQNQSAGQATPEEADLPGARMLMASEPAVTDVLSAKKIKSLTGGDLRVARALHQAQFKYRPTAIPVIHFNRTPKIKDEDEGTRRRLVFFPFDVNLRELPPERRRHPAEVARTLERELPGILNWLLDGFRDFYIRLDAGIGTPPGIDPPSNMLSLKDRLLEAADPVGVFLRDCCEVADDARCRTADFFRAFKAWAADTGARTFSDAAVRENLIEKGFERGKSRGVMVFRGFRLRDDDPMVQGYLAAAAPATPPRDRPHPDMGDF